MKRTNCGCKETVDTLEKWVFQAQNDGSLVCTYSVTLELSNPCSNNGYIDSSYKCKCNNGWKGNECEIRDLFLEPGVKHVIESMKPSERVYFTAQPNNSRVELIRLIVEYEPGIEACHR